MSPIDCQRCRAHLDQRWDGAPLTPEGEAMVQEHLGACLACTAYEAEMAGLLATAGEMKALAYERPIEIAPLRLQPGPRRSPWPWLAGLAASTAALLAGLHFGQSPPALAPPAPAAPEALVRFVVPAPQASSVAVVGDFTGWTDPIPLAITAEGLWVGELKLEPGRYRYVIVLDGVQMQPDPAARQVVDDGFGGKSSVLHVGSL